MTSATTTRNAARLRRDATANRDRVLAAALVAVKREGEKVPLATIAHAAGVGIGTLYRCYPTREALLGALGDRSYRLVLRLAQQAADSDASAIACVFTFLDRVIHHRTELVLPFHGGPVALDEATVQLRVSISDAIESILRRGWQDGTIRGDVTSVDIIITGALLAQSLPHAPDWDVTSRRQVRIFLDGLAPAGASPLPGHGLSRAQLELSHGRAAESKARR
jgi:AcrR family transcriptional regulator